MNSSFSLQQISKSGTLDSILISRRNKLSLMAEFMRLKNENPKLKQFKVASQLGFSFTTLQRYRNDIKMLSPFRIKPNVTNKRTKIDSNTNFDNN